MLHGSIVEIMTSLRIPTSPYGRGSFLPPRHSKLVLPTTEKMGSGTTHEPKLGAAQAPT
jgi:hypothetical protein